MLSAAFLLECYPQKEGAKTVSGDNTSILPTASLCEKFHWEVSAQCNVLKNGHEEYTFSRIGMIDTNATLFRA